RATPRPGGGGCASTRCFLSWEAAVECTERLRGWLDVGRGDAMSVDALDRLQERKLQALDEFIADYSISVAGKGVDDQLAAIGDFAVDEGIELRQELMRYWDYYWTMALAGRLPDRQKAGEKVRFMLDWGARNLARCAALARILTNLSGQAVARLT